MSSAHRVDPPHPPLPSPSRAEPAKRPLRIASLAYANGGPDQGSGTSSACLMPRGHELDLPGLAIFHAEDLLSHVQRLSEDLDARSAKLHADIATHERRERAFRLWAQQRAQEIRCQQDQCNQQHAMLQAQARRLALTAAIIPA